MNYDKIVSNYPSNQNAVDCFSNLWYSSYPPEYEVSAGNCLAFEDGRLKWALQNFKVECTWDVLELGPLEGAHGYFLEKNTPVRSITSIEGNRQCWLKCLITKEITDLKRTRFLLGNFIEYFKNCSKKYDLCLAIGVLYHMSNPLELIYLIGKNCDRVIIWTQIADNENKKGWIEKAINFNSFQSFGYVCDYGSVPDSDAFIGGVESYSIWLKKNELIAALKYFGFKKIVIGMEGQNEHGYYINLVAEKETSDNFKIV